MLITALRTFSGAHDSTNNDRGRLEAIGRLLYLSWGADLMRDALAPDPVEHAVPRLLTVLALGALGLLIGGATIVRFLRRARSEGTLSQV